MPSFEAIAHVGNTAGSLGACLWAQWPLCFLQGTSLHSLVHSRCSVIVSVTNPVLQRDRSLTADVRWPLMAGTLETLSKQCCYLGVNRITTLVCVLLQHYWIALCNNQFCLCLSGFRDRVSLCSYGCPEIHLSLPPGIKGLHLHTRLHNDLLNPWQPGQRKW
jgi:DNA polymerase III psi subunit